MSKKNDQIKKRYIFVPLGQYLSKARKGASLSQREVADKMGYSSPQFISNIERGLASVPIEQLGKIVELYSISPNNFLKFYLNLEKNYVSEFMPKK